MIIWIPCRYRGAKNEACVCFGQEWTCWWGRRTAWCCWIEVVKAKFTTWSIEGASNRWTSWRDSTSWSPSQVGSWFHQMPHHRSTVDGLNSQRRRHHLIYDCSIWEMNYNFIWILNFPLKLGKKNKLRVYYLSWLRNRILHNDPEVEKKQGWITVGDLEGCVHYKVGTFRSFMGDVRTWTCSLTN